MIDGADFERRMLEHTLPATKQLGVGFDIEMRVIIPRVSLYAGAFWSTIFTGMGAGIRRLTRQSTVRVRVRRFLDLNAKHCLTCPGKAGIYDSWDQMLAFTGGVPADGSDQCQSNCRCWVEFEDPSTGVFEQVFSQPVIPITALGSSVVEGPSVEP